jgi:hypothetical protein
LRDPHHRRRNCWRRRLKLGKKGLCKKSTRPGGVLVTQALEGGKTDSVVLSFSEEDARGVVMPHDDALVVTLTVANHGIHRILVDNGSSADILYWSAF